MAHGLFPTGSRRRSNNGLRRGLKRMVVATARACELVRRLARDRRGNIIIISGLLMPVLVGGLGLGIEIGLWLQKHRRMQSAADSAAVSAATVYYNRGTAADLPLEAGAVAASYGFVNGQNGASVTVNRPPQSGDYMTTSGAIEVIVAQPQSRLYSALWNPQPFTIAARAVAVANGGLGCVLALDSYARGAATLQGTSEVVLNGCSLFDNSMDTAALTVGGSAALTALSVGVVGGISGSSITTTNGILTGQAAIADPYASVTFAAFSGCDQHNYSEKNTATINPGVYCGGIKLNAGANVTLSPGIYYLDEGDLTVNGGATLSGTGVTLVFTSSSGHNYATATINGGATVNLTAPTSGVTAGLVMFGDRAMPLNTSFKFNGGAAQDFGGALYVPRAAATFAGGSGTGTSCTQLVANTITFVGNSNFAINCNGRGTRPVGSAMARPIE
jgi:hypothetical protein